MCQDRQIKSKVIPKIASCFGGGIGNTGSVCGAVSGAVMAIGLVKERGETMEDWFRVAAVGREFRRRFEAEVGTISCRDLTGIDLNNPEEVQKFMESDKPQTVCGAAVGLAYRIVTDLLNEDK